MREGDSWTVIYETNGGSKVENETISAFEITKWNAPVTTKEGYEFGGWYLNENLTDRLASTPIPSPSVDEYGCVITPKIVTLYAR